MAQKHASPSIVRKPVPGQLKERQKIIGGYNNKKDFLSFDSTNNTISKLPDMNTGRYYHGIVYLKDRI